MQYKLSPENKQLKNIKDAKKSPVWCLGKTVSATKNVKPTPVTVANSNEYGICFSVINLPSLLAKVSFVIKRVLLAKVTINGMLKDVIKAIIENNLGSSKMKLAKEAIENPPTIPNQKIKFHSLSLLSHLLSSIEFVSSLLRAVLTVVPSISLTRIRHPYFHVNFHYGIISKIRRIIKQIIIMPGIIWLLLANTAHASTSPEISNLITLAEQEYNIPKWLLLAVAKTESDLQPFALNIEGRPVFTADKNIALKTIRKSLDLGITNMDIGIAQINYRWHGSNFNSIEDMISPKTNIKYAAKLLSQLKQEHGSWHKAIASPDRIIPYNYSE